MWLRAALPVPVGLMEDKREGGCSRWKVCVTRWCDRGNGYEEPVAAANPFPEDDPVELCVLHLQGFIVAILAIIVIPSYGYILDL